MERGKTRINSEVETFVGFCHVYINIEISMILDQCVFIDPEVNINVNVPSSVH